jgi:hypothetical protein
MSWLNAAGLPGLALDYPATCAKALRTRTVHIEDGKICIGPSKMRKEG